jgi:putative ABC transport system ATP-binding protein
MDVPRKSTVPRLAAGVDAALVGWTGDASGPSEEAGGLIAGAESRAALPSEQATEHTPSTTTIDRRRDLMLEARQLTKEYQSGDHKLAVLRDVNFAIPDGAFVAIVGPSGSGKTTLLGLLAGLDVPSRGSVLLDGDDLTRLSEDQRARLRGEKVGFVFQSFQLIPTLTALENVQVPLELRGDDGAPERARELLARVGLGDRFHHFPNQLSGGEQQRVAIARAFSNAPRLLFADEPTGNLDSETGARIVELLEGINRESRTTIILVTHDLNLARRAQRIIRLADGAVVSDAPAPTADDEAGGEPAAALSD